MSGGIRVCAIYADRLRRRGHRVSLVTMPHKDPTLRHRVASLLKGRGMPPRPPTGPSHFDALDLERITLDRFRDVRNSDVPDADVVIATWWETAPGVARLSPAKGSKVYFIQHYEADLDQPTDRVDATWRLPMHRIVVAEWLAELGRRRFDVESTVVPNSVDAGQFHAPPHGKQPVPTVGMLYTKMPSKGCDLSLRAFEMALQSVPNLRLLAFGQPEVAPELPLPPGARYERNPPQDRIREIYASCDAWLFGSRSEGFGLPILEAMACRTPVIATPAGAAPELLSDGSGMLVKPEDPGEMARAIVRVAALSDADWRQLSESAYQRATGYTWDDATDLFEGALVRAAEEGRRAAVC